MSGTVILAPCREALGSLAPLFGWPGESYLRQVEEARALAGELDRRAAKQLESFASAIAALTPGEREITYTATFDLAPSCSPYLGIQIFGDDGRDRARLMVGLRARYAAAGHDPGGELPDHLALVLAFASHFDDEEWSDLLRLILGPALETMERLLAGTSNPYRHLIAGARRLTRVARDEGGRA